MPDLTTAYNFCVEKCNAPNVRYSQQYRRGQIINGLQYYDCSSLMAASLTEGGFFSSNPWFSTRSENTALLNAGFERYDANKYPWANGDVLWRNGHTEMVYDAENWITMGAHTGNADAAKQVSINTYSGRGKWTYGYRYPGQIVLTNYQWFAKENGGYSRTSTEGASNAVMTYAQLHSIGWFLGPICGVLADIEMMSNYNPWRWEGDVLQPAGSDLAYGLVKFDPSTIYILNENAQTCKDYSPHYFGNTGTPEDGNAQLEFLDKFDTRYAATERYPYTYAQYKVLLDITDPTTGEIRSVTAAECARIWALNYRRVTDPSVSDSYAEIAEYWEENLMELMPEPPPQIKNIEKFPVWMLNRYY